MFCFPLSFYNYKSLEKGVAPNVTLTSLPLEKVGLLSPSRPSTSQPRAAEAPRLLAKSRSSKKRAKAEFPAPEAAWPPASAAARPPPPPPEDSEVEIEVESRDEGELMFAEASQAPGLHINGGACEPREPDLSALSGFCSSHSGLLPVLLVVTIVHLLQQLSQRPELTRGAARRQLQRPVS